MQFHDVQLLCGALKLDVFAAIIAAGVGLFVLVGVGVLNRALFSVLL